MFKGTAQKNTDAKNCISLDEINLDSCMHECKKVKFSHTHYQADSGVQAVRPAGDFSIISRAFDCHYFPPGLGHLPSRRTSTSFNQYQVILLGDRGTEV